MSMASEEADTAVAQRYSPTYRQQDVDETLDDHEARLSRLEKAALVGAGYAIAEAPDIVNQVLSYAL